MKKTLLFVPLCSLMLFQSCQETKDEQVTQTKQAAAVKEQAAQENAEAAEEIQEAVCVWDKTALRDSEGEKGKWLTALSLGEKVVFEGETKKVKEGSREREYHKVKLQDGKEGWVRGDLVIAGAKRAAVITTADIYSRSDLLTKTDKSFSQMDIVAVKGSQNGFVEVTGKRTDGKWLESGWIREGNVSYKDIDIAVAKYGKAAVEIEDKAEKIKKLREITENGDFTGSTFITVLKTTADDLEAEKAEVVEQEDDFSDVILEENLDALD